MTQEIFAIGDVHGCADELEQLLTKLPLKDGAVLIFLGDYVDRGPDSRGVIDLLLDLEKRHPIITLKGNHESMFLDFLETPHSKRGGMFIFNGGSSTLASYADASGKYQVLDTHVEFLRRLKIFYESDEHFFVHAGVPEIPLHQIDPIRQESILLWTRKRFLESNYRWSKIIVHGHTRVKEVDVRDNRINLDTACAYGGKLSALRVGTGQVYSIPRDPSAGRVFLRDFDDQRAAIRFDGVLDVTIMHGGRLRRFETLNYNELGMFLRDVYGGGPPLEKDEIIKGVVGGDLADKVSFTGRIVRAKVHEDGIYYAVQVYPNKNSSPL